MNTSMLKVYKALLMPPKSCMQPKGQEEQICIKFANALRGWTLDGKLNAVWFHVPNEFTVTRTKEAGIGADGKYKFCQKFNPFHNLMKSLGKYSGVSDYVFGNSDGMYCIEFKSKKSYLTDNQKAFKSWCEIKGVRHGVARSFEEAESKLKEWGILQ
jgi:hypothetical protein